MNVLFVTRKYPPMVGGMEALSYFLTTGFPAPKTIVALCRRQTHLFWFLPYALLRVALTSQRYDVVHLGDPLLGVVGLVPRFLAKRPVFVTVHGLDMTYESRLYQWYFRRFVRGSAYVAISKSTREIAVEHGLSPVEVVPVGVPDRFFALVRDANADAELVEKRDGRVVLLTVGRLVKRKGVAWFIRNVLPRLEKVLYVVVGEGEDREDIERAIAETNAAPDVLLLGKVSEERLTNLLRSSDIFVMPNIVVPGDVEGFGIVALEAAASGLCVVAPRLQGIKDAILDGENGVLVEPEDRAAFANALAPLVSDAAARKRLGDRARAVTQREYAWPKVVARYEELFRASLAERASR
jgi:phosphatidylinositol alpha-1,6-mannosyltransferase